MTTVAVIGDVHGNARALEAALARVRTQPFEHLVFIGDLLTYGHDGDEVLAMVEHAQACDRAVLLIGNHDQMYFDLMRGDRSYVARLPDWIRDSVERTTEAIALERLAALRWDTEHVIDGVLFAHANPFGGRDWTYVESEQTLNRARVTLRDRGLRAGVFGHTHRPRWDGALIDGSGQTWRDRGAPLVANVGAVGQPRDESGDSWIARFTLGSDLITCSYESISYDVIAHLAAVSAAGLQPDTVAHIASFFARGRRRS